MKGDLFLANQGESLLYSEVYADIYTEKIRFQVDLKDKNLEGIFCFMWINLKCINKLNNGEQTEGRLEISL